MSIQRFYHCVFLGAIYALELLITKCHPLWFATTKSAFGGSIGIWDIFCIASVCFIAEFTLFWHEIVIGISTNLNRTTFTFSLLVRFQAVFILKWCICNRYWWLLLNSKCETKRVKSKVTHCISRKSGFWFFLAIHGVLCCALVSRPHFEMIYGIFCILFSLYGQFPYASSYLQMFWSIWDKICTCTADYHRALRGSIFRLL